MCVIIILMNIIFTYSCLNFENKNVMSKKRRSKDTLLIEQRDRDFFKAYCDVLKKHGEYAKVITKTQLLKEAIEMPAPQFYVGEQNAKRIVNKMIKDPTMKVNE